jgi:uncharacterized damage-inducible protein DinB
MDQLALYLAYHEWAHERLLACVSGLAVADWNRPTGGSFPTLKALYQHVLEADYRWLQRWKGVPIAEVPANYVVEGYESLETLFRPQLREILAEGKRFLEADANRNVYFITAKGLHVNQPFWQTLYQVVNHGTYHRGQVVDALRILGGQPVGTDIFLFFGQANK